MDGTSSGPQELFQLQGRSGLLSKLNIKNPHVEGLFISRLLLRFPPILAYPPLSNTRGPSQEQGSLTAASCHL